jgi:hypothetical protein
VSCRFVATDRPRVIRDRHSNPCECDGDFGCLPCPESHCVVCGQAHAAVTCTECLEAARGDLRAIGDLCSALPEEAAVKGVDSEAMMLLGPSANPEAWKHRMISAAYWGRLDAAYLEDCRDELHPTWVLGTWEQVWRDHLEHYTENPFTLAAGWEYLDKQIGYMSDQPEPAFEDFARDLRACRRHLEDVLRDGVREERGAPCVQCRTPMVRKVTDSGASDDYHCHTCRRDVRGDQYLYAVGVAYRAHAACLTATDLGEKIGVKPSVIRVWGSRGLVRKRGRTTEGVTLYDVADAEARHELGGEAS